MKIWTIPNFKTLLQECFIRKLKSSNFIFLAEFLKKKISERKQYNFYGKLYSFMLEDFDETCSVRLEAKLIKSVFEGKIFFRKKIVSGKLRSPECWTLLVVGISVPNACRHLFVPNTSLYLTMMVWLGREIESPALFNLMNS